MLLLVSFNGYAQQTPEEQDSLKTGVAFGKLQMPNPKSIESKYTYDPILDRYVYSEKLGDFDTQYPIILTPKEFKTLLSKEQLKDYYKEIADAQAGQKEGAEEGRKNLIPDLYVNSGLFKTIFGSNVISVVPQGSAEIDFGILFSRQENPNISPQNQSNFTFDFDQRISLSLLGKVGTRLQVTANYDTEATFDFQNLIKLEFDPAAAILEEASKTKAGQLIGKARDLSQQRSFSGEDDSIIKKIEVGNVNMPLNSSLIRGAQSLFGVKTQLQFGRTTVTAVFSEQQSQSTSVVAQGGGTLEEFEFFARDYDENRHYFLSQYFRDNYNNALVQYPFINNRGIQITRLEVWVTNRNNQTQNVRNIVAFEDLGESNIQDLGFNPVPPNFIINPNPLPDNSVNELNPNDISGARSILTESVRDIASNNAGVDLSVPVREGFEYGRLEAARKLNEGQDYTLNADLGYISLNQRLLNDEVLGVAFQYTLGGEVFQVGEFANDGVDATNVDTDPTTGNQTVDNQALIVKMLKSAVTVVDRPIWDLMMKNVYDTGTFQLSQEDFRLNIFYAEASPLNYITPVQQNGVTVPFGQLFDNNTPNNPDDDTEIQETPLIRLFNFDRLNQNGDIQSQGDGFFDFYDGITVIVQNGKIVFTKVEPFGEHLFNVLSDPNDLTENYTNPNSYNPNQAQYVYDLLYSTTKTQALEDSDKDKFQIKGRFKGSSGGGGIPIGAFNVPRGSVTVTAGGRVLVEGIDYTVNYQLGRVEILDPALEASNTPIDITVENNAVFGQQTRRFMAVDVQHEFNENFVLGATFLNLNERPITQKANFDTEPINNTILGFNGNYSTEVPFLTRMVNKLPNIDTDVPSNISVRGEFAYLLPGAPKGTDFNDEATAYIDDFEGNQSTISLLSPLSWFLSSRPLDLNRNGSIDEPEDQNGIQNGYGRALLNWYTIDPIFYSNQSPDGITEDDISKLSTRRVFINEIFPNIDIVQGQTSIINTLDLAYYPSERGPYNFDTVNTTGNNRDNIENPEASWAGITRAITTTDFEQANVEFIEFWLQDPFIDSPGNTGGKLYFNLGNISEDVLKDGRKLYENGLPENGNSLATLNPTPETATPYAVPNEQSLIYTFATEGAERNNQDIGLDGYNDAEETQMLQAVFNSDPNFGPDPAKDNYNYYLNTSGDILERYKAFNGTQSNTPDVFTNTNRGSTTQPDVEDINRDNTMNTIDSYFEYEIEISPNTLNLDNAQIFDTRNTTVTLPNGENRDVDWYQFRIPISDPNRRPIGGIQDIRSVRFVRMYLQEFTQNTVLRFGTLDLVRSDWRRFNQDLDNDTANNSDSDNFEFNLGLIGVQENDNDRYQVPPGVEREELNNNNNIIRQNEQSLVLQTCALESTDSKGVFKNINLDMRQYKRLRMFLHAEAYNNQPLTDDELVAFIRLGNDFTDNFYQIEVPLTVSRSSSTPRDVWPEANEINIPLEFFQQIKARGISAGTLINEDPTFYDVIDGSLGQNSVEEFPAEGIKNQRVAIKGNPNFGNVRVLMVGIKNGNSTGVDACGEVWFNELRMSGLDNEGGWAAVVNVDSNIADFMDVSATGRRSTSGFGGIEDTPNQRSREDIQQYDVVTNMQLGQLLPKKWGLQIPFNYAQSEELVTPEFDQFYNDLTLESRLDAAESAEEEEQIRQSSESYTKRKSINFIGVRKQRTGDATPRFYDIENFTFNYSNNKVEHRDFEIEKSLDQNVRVGVNYQHSFQPIKIEPFKKNDSLFTGKYWKILKDFNLNLLPSNFTINSEINRQFNSQKFREIDLSANENNIQVEELFRRNYTFDFQYTINYQLTNSLNFNFSAQNSNIVRNYFVNDDIINGRQDPNLDIWDGFFDVGDPNLQIQQFELNYELPINKIPALDFIKSTYAYNGTFQWQKGSDLNQNITIPDEGTFNLGHSIQNSNRHSLNSSLNMNLLYKTLGIKKINNRTRNRKRNNKNKKESQQQDNQNRQGNNKNAKTDKLSIGQKAYNTFVDVITMVKRVQFGYTENNGTYLPGYLPTPGFIGTLRPTFGYTFGSQRDIRNVVASNGWLTTYQNFNEQYTEVHNSDFNYSINLEPMRDLTIDLVGNRAYSENFTENFRVLDLDEDGELDYESLTPNTFGSFNISTALIGTAFSSSSDTQSKAFDDFRENRLVIANRLASKFYGTTNFPTDTETGYPVGFGRNSQRVLLPAFLAAYQGRDPEKITTRAFRDVPIPNWTLKYTGLMRIPWFKKTFRRFSIQHGYRSTYTINQFRTNLDYDTSVDDLVIDPDTGIDVINPINQDESNNLKSERLYSNINLEERFSPLVRIEFELKNSLKVLTEVARDRLLSLSFDNNLLTEVQGQQYTLGLGYRIKDLRIRSKLAGPRQIIKSDLNMRADISVRDNKTIIRYLDLDNSEITAGQTIWNAKFTADYAFSKNLTALFFFDYNFSDFAISTSFPQTAIRSGFTLRYNFGN